MSDNYGKRSYQNDPIDEVVGNSSADVINEATLNEGIPPSNGFLGRFTTSGHKIPLTFIYCITFWNFGICVAIFGPTLLDLACQTSSTLSAMSLLYFLQNFTSLLGCFLSGILVKKRKIEINDFLLICTFLMPVCVALMPLAKHIFFLGLVMIVLGFNMGCIDNIANLAILKLHSNNVSPFIQTMHFFYGVGAFLTPIIVKSFLNSNFDFTTTSSSFNCYNIEDVQEYMKKKPYLQSSSNLNPKQDTITIFNQTVISDEMLPNILMSRTQFTSQTKYAFWILSLIQLPTPIILLLIKLSGKNSRFNTNYYDLEKQDENKASNDLNTAPQGSTFSIDYFKSLFDNMPELNLTILISLLVFFFEGIQASHGGYIFSYTVEKYDMKQKKFSIFKNSNDTRSKLIINRHNHHSDDDAFITATFWAFFSIGRLASIFIATKFSSTFMILVDIIGCILSTVIMLLSSFLSMISLLYLATCLLGLFLSNTTPTSYSLAEIHIGMTPTLTSFIIICAATGEMIFPLIVANLFESVGPNSLIVVEFIISICAAFTFLRFILYAKEHAKSYDSRDSFIWLSAATGNQNGTEMSTNINAAKSVIGKTSNNYYNKMEEESD